MKQFVTLCIFLCLVCVAGAADTKIAYVDIEKVTGKAKAINSALSTVGDKVKKYQNDIESKRKKIRDLEDDVKRTEGVLSRDEVDKKRKEINTLNNEIDDLVLQGRREMQRVDDTFYSPLLKKIIYAIQDVAAEKDIDIVLRGEVVLYGKDTADITNDVIRKLNEDDSASTAARTEKKTETPAKPADTTAKPTESASPAAANVVVPETPAKPKPTKTPASARPVDRQPD
ncbi:MAG: OmpH family outer membrane protein [Candidatus Sumerlaeaceae bacterium]